MNGHSSHAVAANSRIDRRRGLSHRDFVREYLRPQRPVILTDAIDHWPALGHWTPQYFRTAFGQRPVTVDGRQWRRRNRLASKDFWQ